MCISPDGKESPVRPFFPPEFSPVPECIQVSKRISEEPFVYEDGALTFQLSRQGVFGRGGEGVGTGARGEGEGDRERRMKTRECVPTNADGKRRHQRASPDSGIPPARDISADSF